jgi:hypothetical protein
MGQGRYEKVDWEKLMAPKGFQVLPHRWVVERTFSWIDRNRRMSKDYERLCASGEAFVYAAMIRLMTRRLVRTWDLFIQSRKRNSRKSICRILHKLPSESFEDGFLGHSSDVRGIYILWSWIDMRDLDALQGDDLAALLQAYPPTLYWLGWKLQSGEEWGVRIALSGPPNVM